MSITFNPFTGQFDYLGAGGSAPVNYYSLFNSTTDWGAASGGFYTITIPSSTHGKGNNPMVEIFELNGGNYEKVFVDQVLISAIGDISFRVPSSPDLRFIGKIVIN